MSNEAGKKATEGKGVVLIAGPTASGKSALALALAEAFDGVIINADSMQVYHELAVLTARPSAAEESRVPHRLYGVFSAAQPCSVGRWRELALDEIAAARRAAKVAILVGGTGLYFRALDLGLAPVPEIPGEVRADARELYERLGPEHFHEALARRDPRMASRLNANDSQRVMRAWEVIEATGASLAEWQSLSPDRPGVPGPLAKILLQPERPWLYARCDARFAAMVEAGALDEVRALRELGLERDAPVMKALGVRELGRHIDGEITLEEALGEGQRATRRYAKRQTTWFRHQMADARVVVAQDSESIEDETFSFIREFLLTAKT